MRVLITASRDWENYKVICHDLDTLAERHVKGQTMTVMHGDCPTGGDFMTRQWCEAVAQYYGNLGIQIVEERYPAAWQKYGKRAGFKRNEEMVNLRPDYVFAYIRDRSHGATHTARLALDTGLRLIVRRA